MAPETSKTKISGKTVVTGVKELTTGINCKEKGKQKQNGRDHVKETKNQKSHSKMAEPISRWRSPASSHVENGAAERGLFGVRICKIWGKENGKGNKGKERGEERNGGNYKFERKMMGKGRK